MALCEQLKARITQANQLQGGFKHQVQIMQRKSMVGQAATEERMHSTFTRGGGSIGAHFYRPGFRPSPAHVC